MRRSEGPGSPAGPREIAATKPLSRRQGITAGRQTIVLRPVASCNAGNIKLTKRGKPRKPRATKAQMQARRDAIYDIVRDAQPTGIRFAYYTATTRGVVDKDDSGYNMVQQAILKLRRTGAMPWPWIVDTNRWMRKPRSYSSGADAIAQLSASYRQALWDTTDAVVEVWCESESVAGVLYPATSSYDVPLYPIKGQTSDSFAYGAAQTYRGDRRPLHIYYVGDCDPAGFEIETNLHAKLVEHSGGTDITFTRLACTIEQAETMQLPGGKAKKSSYVDAVTRARMPWSRPAVEVEALDPNHLRQLVTDAITSHIDEHALAINAMVEEQELAGLEALAGGWSS